MGRSVKAFANAPLLVQQNCLLALSPVYLCDPNLLSTWGVFTMGTGHSTFFPCDVQLPRPNCSLSLVLQYTLIAFNLKMQTKCPDLEGTPVALHLFFLTTLLVFQSPSRCFYNLISSYMQK